MTDTHDSTHDLIPAYALGALDDPAEKAAVERLLAADPAARALLAEYEQVTAALAFSAPSQPAPDHLQDDLRTRLAASSSNSPPPRRQSSRMYIGLAALAAIFVVVIGVVALVQNNRNAPVRLYRAINAQTEARHYPLEAGEAGDAVRGDLIVSPDGTQAVIAADDLPVIEPDQVFQLWLRTTEGEVSSGGLFQGTGGGITTYVTVTLSGTLNDYAAFGVSLEPMGGSPYADQPTGPRVFFIPVDGNS